MLGGNIERGFLIMKYKYYFVYKTTVKTTNQYYIGMHCTNDMNDGYFGSGEKLKKIISKYGTGILKREILAFAENRKQLMALEGFYINGKNKTDDLCLNIANGLSKEKQLKYKSETLNSTLFKTVKTEYEHKIKNYQSDIRLKEFKIKSLINIVNSKDNIIEELKNKDNIISFESFSFKKEHHKLTELLKTEDDEINELNIKLSELKTIIESKEIIIKSIKQEIQESKMELRKHQRPVLSRNLAKLLYTPY